MGHTCKQDSHSRYNAAPESHHYNLQASWVAEYIQLGLWASLQMSVTKHASCMCGLSEKPFWLNRCGDDGVCLLGFHGPVLVEVVRIVHCRPIGCGCSDGVHIVDITALAYKGLHSLQRLSDPGASCLCKSVRLLWQKIAPYSENRHRTPTGLDLPRYTSTPEEHAT